MHASIRIQVADDVLAAAFQFAVFRKVDAVITRLYLCITNIGGMRLGNEPDPLAVECETFDVAPGILATLSAICFTIVPIVTNQDQAILHNNKFIDFEREINSPCLTLQSRRFKWEFYLWS